MKLIENKRLDSNDADAKRFDEFLLCLRNGDCTRNDWKYIRDIASKNTVSNEKWEPFEGDDVIHLYSTNKEVNKRNIECLQRVGKPIVRIDAEHTGDGRKASSNQANGLESKVFLCKGAFVLLTKNVWQSAGLCNGATGKVVDLIFSERRPPPGLPECVVIDFGENYTGPPLFGDQETIRRGWVPIYPEYSEWYTSSCTSETGTESNSQKMLPLRLCYAWTVWKAQGQTISTKVVASLGDTEKEHGLTYTGFSRVRKASDIGIINGLTCERLLDKVKNHGKMKARILEERRLNQIVKRTTKNMQKLEPLDLPDARVAIVVDVGVDAGSDIDVGIVAGNNVGAGENASSVYIIRPLKDNEHARVREAMYGVGDDLDIFTRIDDGTEVVVQRKSMRTLQPGIWINDEIINFYMKLLAKRDKALTEANPTRKRSHFFLVSSSPNCLMMDVLTSTIIT